MAKAIDYAPLKTGFPADDIVLPMTATYNNNPLIKGAYYKITYTHEHLRELYRCMSDPVYFFENYVKIVTLDHGLTLFKPYPYQKQLIQNYKDNRFNIVKQSRQSGKTTVTAAFVVWYAIFNKDKTIAVLANKGDQAQEIVDRIRTTIENLPFYLQPGVITWNKRSLEFENGSKIFSAATSGSSIRGRSVDLLYVDEAAFIQNDEEFFTSTYPVITSGKNSKVILTSTPKGQRGTFYKLYIEAESGVNAYKHFNVTWREVPGRDEKWASETISNTSIQQFEQEFECTVYSTLVNISIADEEFTVPVGYLEEILEDDDILCKLRAYCTTQNITQ